MKTFKQILQVLAISGAAFALPLLLWAQTPAPNNPPDTLKKDSLGKDSLLLDTLRKDTLAIIQPQPIPMPPPPKEMVKTGIQLMNIYDLDINKHSFYADFYVWFKWKGTRNPMDIEFTNAVEKWGATRKNFYENPKLLPDGYYYNGMRVEGRFVHPFELGRFPLDEHVLNINVEHSLYPADSMIFVPDSISAVIRDKFHLPGWDITKYFTDYHTNIYPTNFGETGAAIPQFSNFSFRLTIARPVNYFLLKLLLPLLISILVSLGGLLIYPTFTEARISVPIGSLLAVVFLQQSYSSSLPDVGYMVLMDKIYLLVYCMITTIVFWMVWIGNKHAHNEVDVAGIRKKDLLMVSTLFIGLLIGISLLVFIE